MNASSETHPLPCAADRARRAARAPGSSSSSPSTSASRTTRRSSPRWQRLRDRGVRLAVDDAGAGFASLQHILRLTPDIIKLDRTFIEGLADDPVRRALTTALVTFAGDIGATLVAEGIATAPELEALRRIGVRHGQGMFLGEPAALPFDPDRFAHLGGAALDRPGAG